MSSSEMAYQCEQSLSVRVDFLKHFTELFFECLLLFTNDTAQQLLF
jgi:hypothetical protein